MATSMLRALVLYAVLASPLLGQADACRQRAFGVSNLPRLAVSAGAYDLTMVATAGTARGEASTGRLVLARTRDGEATTYWRGKVRTDTLEHPLAGYVTLDFDAIGAPMAPATDTIHPAPTSRAVRYPGALVSFFAEKPGSPGQLRVLIGTLHNRREPMLWADGAGVFLEVVVADKSGFSGTWDAYGIIHNGSGHFCATRTEDDAAPAP